MTTIRDELPELAEFLGAYFNQDFSLDYESYDAAINEFLTESTTTEWASAIVRDVDEVLSRNLSDAELTTYVVDSVMGVIPDRPIAEFLLWVRDRIAATL